MSTKLTLLCSPAFSISYLSSKTSPPSDVALTTDTSLLTLNSSVSAALVPWMVKVRSSPLQRRLFS